MKNLALLLLVFSACAYGQEFPAAYVTLFDAVTLDESRIQLSVRQCSDVEDITRFARARGSDKALHLWKQFVTETYISGRHLDYEAIALLIVRDAYFDFVEVRAIGNRYAFYRGMDLKLRSLAADIEQFVELADQSDLANLKSLQSRIDMLAEEQRQLNEDGEMVMLRLQEAMQQRSQILQAGANLLAAMNDATKTIVGNLR